VEAGVQSAAMRARFGFDWFDWLMLSLVALLSVAVIGPLLIRSGGAITGGDGLFPVDQLQYLSWVRQAGAHGLIADRFDLAPDTRDFLHPSYLLSGLGHRLFGIPIAFSVAAVWKPIAVIVAFLGARQYTRRLTAAVWPARAALALALFLIVPASTLLGWFGAGYRLRYNLDFISSEIWPGQQLVGYEVAVVAIFLVPLLLIGVEKSREGQRPWLLASCALGAMFVSWVQPWQGAELLLIVAGVEVWRWARHRVVPRWSLLWIALLGLVPAIYYALLQRSDSAWKLAGQANAAGANPDWDWSWWAILICIAPLLLAALPALRRAGNDWQQTAVRIWPLAVLIVYLQPFGTFPFHAVQGLSVPLAVLAVQGMTTWRPTWVPKPRWWWVLPAVLVLTIPGAIHRLGIARDNVNTRIFPYEFRDGEREALRLIETSPHPGGVLANGYAGLLVPAYAGRDVFVGTHSWTPDFEQRSRRVNQLLFNAYLANLSGKPANPIVVRESQRFVNSTGARFIYEECGGWRGGAPDLASLIGPLIERSWRFGCARVYLLKPTDRSRQISKQLGGTDGP